jgi:hypothetical protein
VVLVPSDIAKQICDGTSGLKFAIQSKKQVYDGTLSAENTIG